MTGTPPPGGWPPPPGGWQPPHGPPPYPYRPPPPSNDAAVVIGLAVAGAIIYFAINFAAGLIVLVAAGGTSNSQAVVAIAAVLLAGLAFGGGAGLLALRRPWAKGLGLGLMIGWALTSLVTVGICTGLNPAVYQGL